MESYRQIELDIGTVLDGELKKDAEGKLILIEDDGSLFPLEERLRALCGQKLRLTFIRLESMEALERLLV